MVRRFGIALMVSCCAYAQGNPVQVQFDFLMGKPKSLVDKLTNYPHRKQAPNSIPGLQLDTASTPSSIRIVSVERLVRAAVEWKHWQSADAGAWVDLVRFSKPADALALLSSARQPHSGYHWANQLLLFSGTHDRTKEAVGAAMASGASVLNIGMKLPLAVNWDRPPSKEDAATFSDTLARFYDLLETVARQVLDPEYVTLTPEITVKPEALSMLRITGFARMWSLVKYNFVYLDQRKDLDWDGVLDEYMPRIAAAKDDIEYGKLLQKVIALLKDGHTGVYPNSVEPHDSAPILLEPIEGKPVAVNVATLSELSAVRPGMELSEIDGTPVATFIERDLDPYISSSTMQDRQLQRMRMLLDGPPDSTARTKWRTVEGGTIEVALTRNRSKNRQALRLPSHDLYEQKLYPGGVAYIALNSFDNNEIVKRFEANFEQLREAPAWIIDLRMNGGGSSSIGYAILKHFIDSTLSGSKQRSRLYNPTTEARGRPQSYFEWETDQIEPAAGAHYRGPVYVLTSPSTCSAAEDFLVPLRIAKRIVTVGEPTCGSTGQPLQFTIYGATGRICTKWDQYPDGTDFVGVGVTPDVPVARSAKDVAAGRDAVLEKALELASAKLK